MHESGLVASLVTRATEIVENTGKAPRRIGVRVGALSGVDPAFVRAHWSRLAGPALAGATLDVHVSQDATEPGATGVSLVYVDVADPAG